MSEEQLRRLRRRLTASYAAVSLVVLVAIAVIAVLQAHDRRHEQLDRLVERTALSASGYAYPEGDPSKLIVDRQPDGYFGPARRPGAPVLVVDEHGKVVAGPAGKLDAAAAKRALARIQDGRLLRVTDDVSGGDGVRVASNPINGSDRLLGAIVAVEPLAGAAHDVRTAGFLIAAAVLGLWLLTIAAGWILAGRALRPAAAVAKREEAFLADAAHELRTPVAVIRARAEQGLRELGEDGPAGPALRAIERAAERASGTIADMLELARLDARRGRMEREKLRLDLQLEQLVEEYEDRAREAGAELSLTAAPDVVVRGDERLLGRSVANLVENAIRYGADGGEIAVHLSVDGPDAVVEVHDRGPGVPPAQHGAVFDRFHRASGAAGGSGLGLPIARLVAEAHDGSLELLPPIDGQPGARFRLRLPLVGEG
ncbi:sensor histidine kinase [Patulibacter minatonensis]|uniref:sensor histidine kinase n=1 Tax=Patulibacter minatonensis TaxID=298163 RepID=UPI00047D0DE4|nr:HAMP domain-containing sensor histidine kinase [Patulibacter minatonensis]